jgi:hypothetical protein
LLARSTAGFGAGVQLGERLADGDPGQCFAVFGDVSAQGFGVMRRHGAQESGHRLGDENVPLMLEPVDIRDRLITNRGFLCDRRRLPSVPTYEAFIRH